MPQPVIDLCEKLRQHKKRGWIVGGCVRDLLLGKKPKDWDVATDARPEEVQRIFPRVIATGIAHGTVTVMIGREGYEVTTLRGEGAYSDGRRPDSVEFVDDIAADLARRDFTVNAIAIDPTSGEVVDPWGGQQDLERKLIRAVGKAEERFAEDGLRVLRAARFSATLDFAIDPDTFAAMGNERSVATFRKVSQERVRDEWMKSMKADKPSVTFNAIEKTGILAVTCPELAESVGCEQNRYHAYDVWGHAMASLDASDRDPVLRIATLFHDIGKPRTRAFSDKTQDYTFYDHERVGAEIAEPILTRLRFSNEEREHVVRLVRHHLIVYEESWTDTAVRRWLRRVGKDLAPDLYRLGRADAWGKGRDCTQDLERLVKLEARANQLIEAGAAFSTKDLAVKGHDLMKELGLKPGPAIGKLLERLLEVVTEEPEKNTREALLAEARQAASAASREGP